MISFSKNLFCGNYRSGPFRSNRLRGFKQIGFLAVLLMALPTQTIAQGADWGKWVDPAIGSEKNIPPGVSYPGGKQCEGMKLSGKHAYWQCMHRCDGGRSSGYCWEGISDAIYTCPEGKGFRKLEKIRYTNVPCGPEDWKKTKTLAELYEETWTKDVPDPPAPGTPSTPPTTTAELPPTTGDSPPTWDGGDPPWAPPKKEADKPESGKTDTGKTDTNTEKKTTTTEQTTTTIEKKVTGGSTGESGAGKKHPRKETRKQGKTVAGGKTNEPIHARTNGETGGLSPDAANAIGIGIGIGLGVGLGNRGHSDRMDPGR